MKARMSLHRNTQKSQRHPLAAGSHCWHAHPRADGTSHTRDVRSPLSAPDAQNSCKSCEASLQPGCSCLLPGSGQRAAAERSGSLIPNPSSAGRAAKLPAAISQSSLLHHLRSSLLGWLVLWVCLQGLDALLWTEPSSPWLLSLFLIIFLFLNNKRGSGMSACFEVLCPGIY